MKTLDQYKKYLILKKEELAPDTFLFRLKGKLKFEPGQFVQISLPHYGEATYAPCSDPEEKSFFEIVIRATGNASNQLVKLLPGDFMEVRGPYGHGWPMGKLIGKNIVLITGGIGIIPIRPLIYQLLKYKKEFKRISLLSGFRTAEFVTFKNDYKYWLKKFDYIKVAVEKTNSDWWGENCMPTDLINNMKLSHPNTVVLICGPEIMFKFCNDILIKKEIPSNQIFISFERRMECGVGLCQHCNIGKYLVCKDGPVFRWDKIQPELDK